MSFRITQEKDRNQVHSDRYPGQLSEFPLLVAIVEELRQIRSADRASLERDARQLLQDVFASKASDLVAA